MTCWNPFIEFRFNVSIYSTCCPAWLNPKSVVGRWDGFTDELKSLGPWEVWNHPVFQNIRRSVLRDDFETHCRPCSRIIAGHLEGTIEPWMKPVMEQPPERLWLEHDRHCQLACPSCRPKVDGHLPYQSERDAKVLEICREFLPTAKHLTLMSAGEPLLSRSTKQIIGWLPQYPQLTVELFTNGLLLPAMWDVIPNQQIKWLNFSLDAASSDVYERVRRPGKWTQAVRALEFASDLRKRGILERVQLNFVVQQANYRDIPAFVRIVRGLGFDVAHLARIIRVWHSEDLYRFMDVCDSRHSEHDSFLQVMQCDELSDPVALFPTIQQFRGSALSIC